MAINGNVIPPAEQNLHLAGSEGTKLCFSGPPRNLTGTIPLVNNSAEKQKVRSAAVKAEKLQGAAGLPLRDIPFYAKLYGGEQASVAASISLDPRTAPGSYDFELTVGSKTLPATAHVCEVVDLEIDPTALTILAGPGTSYTRAIVLGNAGNVPLPTGAQCEVPVFEPYDLATTMVLGLHNSDQKSLESLAKGWLSAWADLQCGTLIAKRKPTTIAPGEKISMEVEFVLPAELKPLRHYRSALQLYNASLSVDIYTSAGFGSHRGKKEDPKHA